MQISAPGDDDIHEIAAKIHRARLLVREHLSREMHDDDEALDLLQALLDADVLDASSTLELQSLGAVLGARLVAAIEGLDWAIVEDEFGRDPALRYLDTSILIFPLTMLSKRIEDELVVDVRGLFLGVCKEIDDLRRRVPTPN